jgi:hypothetical protein
MYEQEIEVLEYNIKQAVLGHLKEPSVYVNYLKQSIYILNYYKKRSRFWRAVFLTSIFVWISISIIKMIL